ncbi:GNVR domain-containing protein [Chamaesiphon sp. OTE_75_metabat_556]|uniref:GumC family protein n=1 Tax=Chamaesiphon sp. OTE_75_metabat_556 TaxID=2964692 RepID=UPI00286A893E|nr:GNVR domain-containing protein [Chamaesiphon sp. OTE_75_metabat_556]
MKTLSAIIFRHWQALAGFNAIVCLVALGAILITPKTWKATAQLILPATNGSSLDANLGTLGSYRNSGPSFSVQVNPLKIQQIILTSDALLEQAWKADPEYNKSPKPNNYARFFTVTIPEQTSIMLLSVTGSSPKVAKERTSALLKAYDLRLNELRQANSATKEKFSRKQLEKARQTLTNAQTAVAEFKRTSGLVDNEEQTKGLVEAINSLSTTQAEAQAQAQASHQRAKNLETRLKLSPGKAVQSLGLDQNQGYNLLRNKLTEAEINLRKLSITYTTNSPQVQQALSDRNSLRLQLQQYVNQAAGTVNQATGTVNQAAPPATVDTTVTSGAEGRSTLIQQLILAESDTNERQQQVDQLQQQIDQRRASLNAIPLAQAKLASLQRQADVAEGVYKGLIAQVQQSNIDAFNSYPNIQVLNAPRVDLKPSSPKLSFMALNAVLASIVGSIALMLLLESRNPLLNPKDIQPKRFPLVVQIPYFKRISSAESALSAQSEVEFQRLASAISQQSLKKTRLLVTSAITGEGKTSIVLGLACALSDLGFRVLMVDGDFRKAELSRRLAYTPTSTNKIEVIEVRQNLDFVPTVPQQSKKIMDLVSQGRFEIYLAVAESSQNYDYVLVDSAPVSLTSETALMSTIVPDILFVVRPGVSTRNLVNESLDLLAQHKAQLIGLVVNGVKDRSSPYYEPTSSAITISSKPLPS